MNKRLASASTPDRAAKAAPSERAVARTLDEVHRKDRQQLALIIQRDAALGSRTTEGTERSAPTRRLKRTATPNTVDGDTFTEGITMAAQFELYEDRAGRFRFRLTAGNGEIIATSSAGHGSKAGAQSSIESIKSNAAGATVVDLS